jgi:NAD(P)-dependent dehydrogenase (short-subunit alcohol dehydrogenase family)
LAIIRVNTVFPGLVDTPIYAGLPEAQRTTLFAVLVAWVPVKRVGQTEDMTQTVLYLMNNLFTTGRIIYEDDDYTLREVPVRPDGPMLPKADGLHGGKAR